MYLPFVQYFVAHDYRRKRLLNSKICNSLDNYIYENIRSKNQFSLISIQSSALDYLWNKFEYWKQHTVSTYQICNQITNKIVIFYLKLQNSNLLLQQNTKSEVHVPFWKDKKVWSKLFHSSNMQEWIISRKCFWIWNYLNFSQWNNFISYTVPLIYSKEANCLYTHAVS